MDARRGKVVELIFGRWRSQILLWCPAGRLRYPVRGLTALSRWPGAAGGCRDCSIAHGPWLSGSLTRRPSPALHPDSHGGFLHWDHPQDPARPDAVGRRPGHYAAWMQLPELITQGQQDAFAREVGESVYAHMDQDPSYAAVSREGLTPTRIDNPLVSTPSPPTIFPASPISVTWAAVTADAVQPPGPVPPPAGDGPGAAQRARPARRVMGRQAEGGRAVYLCARGYVSSGPPADA